MIRYVDIPEAYARTRSVVAPFDGGTSLVTREEYEALLARVAALEALTSPPQAVAARDADRNARDVTTVTRNVSNAERQRRYRERLAARKASG